MSFQAQRLAAFGLLLLMFILAGGAALHESPAVDEIAHVGAGLSYLQRLDLRLNVEHPPLAKVMAALPLVAAGTHADYSGPAWTISNKFFAAYAAQWAFGDAVLGRWNPWKSTLMLARLPMLLLTVLLGWCVYQYAAKLGSSWAGLFCLALYVTTPCILTFGPLVLTDLPVTLFSLIALWRVGDIWAAPSSRNTMWFAFAFAAALLSKFTGLLLFPVIFIFFLQTRVWPTASEPVDTSERKLWRGMRSRAVLRGILFALIISYMAYFVLSFNEPDSMLSFIGHGRWASVIRRPLMPIFIYLLGLGFTLLLGSRTTYLFGHTLAHGVPYYFPVVFVLKSTLSFLILFLVAACLRLFLRKRKIHFISEAFQPHWRLLVVELVVFSFVCFVSRLNISIRHFMLPIVLLILMLAPLPKMIGALPHSRIFQAFTLGLLVSCFVPILLAYPYYLPLVNSLSFGLPAYYLVNDSNVSWNEGLPAVERFVREQHLKSIALDYTAMSDPALIIPEARPWNCQNASDQEAGQWVAVAAVSILENRNCGYLQQYPRQPLAGGSIYVFKLPLRIPPAGTTGGPPLPAQRKLPWGLPMDYPAWMLNMERHPEQMPAQTAAMLEQLQTRKQQKQASNGK